MEKLLLTPSIEIHTHFDFKFHRETSLNTLYLYILHHAVYRSFANRLIVTLGLDIGNHRFRVCTRTYHTKEAFPFPQ